MNIERAPASRSGFFARWTVACGTGEVMGIAAAATCAVVALTVIGEPSTVRERSADGLLVGFVNVAWDGSDHAFLLDTKTRGIGSAKESDRTGPACRPTCEGSRLRVASR